MKPALVITRHHAGMGIIHGLGVKGVPIVILAYDDVKVNASKYVQATVRLPHPERQETEFIAKLLEISTLYQGGLLIPAQDEALVAISKHKETLKEHYVVACTEWNITQLYIDKLHTYTIAEEIGVPSPKTVKPQSIEDVEEYGRTVNYPCLIKPRQSHLFVSHFDTKMFEINSFDELMSKYKIVAEVEVDIMLQEIILGNDDAGANYNSYIAHKQDISYEQDPIEFTARKIRNAPPKYGSPRVVVSEHIPEILENGRKILNRIGFYGFSCVEFKKDARDGIYKLIEINGRHNRSSMLAVKLGLNFPWLEYAELMLDKSPKPADYREGVYWIDLFYDLKHSIRYRKEEEYSILDYLRPYIKPHIFAVFDKNDMGPFISRLIKSVRDKI